MALEAKAGFQFVGHQLEVGRFLEGDELLEESDGLRRPIRPMGATRELGDELRAFPEEASAEPVKMRTADLEVMGGISGVNGPLIELVDDLLEKQSGEAFGELLFL
jgi:hypothetical protein